MQETHVVLVGVATDVAMAALKLTVGLAAGSRALVADALHSLSDVVRDGVTLAGLRAARRPPDEDHSFGHGRYDTITALAIGVFLVVVGAAIAVAAYSSLRDRTVAAAPGAAALWIAGLAIVTKELLFRFTTAAARRRNSRALAAGAWHHRTDALSSIAVFGGIAGARIGGPRWALLDPIAGGIVGLIIVGVGGAFVFRTLREMSDVGLSPARRAQILAAAAEVEGVRDPHNLKTRRLGPAVAVELHFRVSPEMSVRDAHGLASEVERRIRALFNTEARVITHVEPMEAGTHP